MIKFRHANKNDLSNLIDYSIQVFPCRKYTANEIVNFWIRRSDHAIEDILLIDSGNICGQEFYSRMSYFLNGKKEDAYWCFDLYVDQNLRKDCIGIDFMQYAITEYPQYFCTGSGPDAVKLHIALGKQQIGFIRKYVGLINPIWLLSSINRGRVPAEDYPTHINDEWVLIDSPNNIPQVRQPYNDNILEICRDIDFIKWRFFSGLHPYAVYFNKHNNDYFVLTTTIQKNITALCLVDYRCPLQNGNRFRQILKCAHKIGNKIHIPVMICGSSHTEIDKILERRYYKSIGAPRPIIGLARQNTKFKTAIDNREFTLVTLADSDGETLW